MKVSGYITIILVVGLVFATVASIVDDFETEYPEIEVNSSWEDEYNYADEINNSVSGIKKNFDIIVKEDAWFGIKVYNGAAIILKSIIVVPSIIFQTLAYGLIILTKVGKEVGIPAFITVFATVGIFVIVLFKLVSFWHSKTQV